jgi:hypothetical protein
VREVVELAGGEAEALAGVVADAGVAERLVRARVEQAGGEGGEGAAEGGGGGREVGEAGLGRLLRFGNQAARLPVVLPIHVLGLPGRSNEIMSEQKTKINPS